MYHWLAVYHGGCWNIDFGSWNEQEVANVKREYRRSGLYNERAMATVITDDDNPNDIAMLLALKPAPRLITVH